MRQLPEQTPEQLDAVDGCALARLFEIDGIVAEWAGRHPADELTKILENAGVVVGPVNTVAEVVDKR